VTSTALIIAAIVEGALATTDEPLGHWTNPARSVTVEITRCASSASALCGHVRWASDKAKADARSAGTSELVGVELMQDFVSRGRGRWRGRLFVPDLRTRSAAELRLIGFDRLKVTGCTAGKLLCRSQLWIRTSPQAPLVSS